MTLKLTRVEPTGSIMAIPFCSVDCCGGKGVFELRGAGQAISGGLNGEVYRACEGEPEHLGRLVANMLRHKPWSTVTVTLAAPWAIKQGET
jgi:hypothetical protein